MRLKELYPKDRQAQRLYCSKCSKPIELIFEDWDEDLEGMRIMVLNLPLLYCTACDLKYLPERSRLAVARLHFDAWKAGKKQVRSERRKTAESFGFTDVPCIYDSDDYYYIPGLVRPHNAGFLTPVFFEKNVLIKFENSPQYVVSFASKTYGQIYKDTEYGISFGINQHDKVIMWLGDIATLPLNEQYAFRADNVESDHCIGSEFYDAQIECVFTDPGPEESMIKARSTFHRRAVARFGKPLSHLSEESLELIQKLNPPITFSEREISHIFDVLHKLNTETLNATNLAALIADRGETSDKLGNLKKLQKLLQLEFPKEPISSLVAPFFALYDLRVTYLHIHSEEHRRNRLESINQILALPKTASIRDLYRSLLDNLANSYLKLSDIL